MSDIIFNTVELIFSPNNAHENRALEGYLCFPAPSPDPSLGPGSLPQFVFDGPGPQFVFVCSSF